ncbi:TraR/DksA family transcriptional regulator [bacterium]|nr:TraR/DksA family transcriptional regulator [bacterium]
MKKKLLDQLKAKLEEEKIKLVKELSAFAKRDKNLKGDWDTRYPSLGSTSLEEEAEEVEEYGNLLPIENTLELELQKINLALEKIKKGTFGICEKCKKPISEARLKAYPQARYCQKCQPKKEKR